MGFESWFYLFDLCGEIIFENLFYMVLGLDSNKVGNWIDCVYMGGGLVFDIVMYIVLEVKLGSCWKYVNNDIMLVLCILWEMFNDEVSYLCYLYDNLFDKIGM